MVTASPKTKKVMSLKLKISIIAILGTLLVCSMAGGFMIWTFNQSVNKGLRQNLSSFMDILISSTYIHNKQIVVGGTDALENLPRYWQVTFNHKKVIAKSSSLLDPIMLPATNETALYNLAISDGTKILALVRTVEFPGQRPVTYLFGMQEEIAKAYIEQEQQGFIEKLAIIFVGVVVTSVILTWLYIYVMLRPLSHLRHELSLIHRGESTKLPNNFPSEISPLTEDLNTLLDYIRQLMERYKTSASNLSHAIKTPLAAIKNDAQSMKTQKSASILEKVDMIQSLIDRNLNRIKTKPSLNILGSKTEVIPIAERIAKNFCRLYEADYTLETKGENILFKGEEGDLYEVLGNIIENACKYGKGKVAVWVYASTETPLEGHTPYLTITVEDNGEGIDTSHHHTVLERGKRLDETKPGTGIGLSVAYDLIALYHGEIKLGQSEDLGGLKVTITLPQAYTPLAK